VRRSKTIGVVVPDLTNFFYPEVMRGMGDVARQCGYSVIVCDSREDRELESSSLHMVLSRRVDGVLIAPVDPHGARDCLTRQRTPFVFFDRVPRNFPSAAVVTDNLEASREATNYLAALGHKRIAIVACCRELPNVAERVEGFSQAINQNHLPGCEDYFRCVGHQAEEAYGAGLELMRLATPPSAIFTCNNKMTLGVLRALGELHIPCPEDVSVLGFDDFEWASNTSPRLTAIAQPAYEMGKLAMDLLMCKLSDQPGGTEEAQVTVLKNELRVRGSTAPPSPAALLESASTVRPEAVIR
jgi:LacI family transcriptional regulator